MMRSRAARFGAALLLFAVLAVMLGWDMPGSSALAADVSPFAALAGRWTGEGRLGFKDSPAENVKCRATYFLTEGKDELKQNIRCATAGGSIEVQSVVQNTGGVLTGSWKETTRNLEGDLTGAVTPLGLRISVKGTELAANMDIIVRNARQLIEIQFVNSALVGLSLVMVKG